MFQDLQTQLQSIIEELSKEFWPSDIPLSEVDLEVPTDKMHGDFSCNIALKSAKLLKKSPMDIAQSFKEHLDKNISEGQLGEKVDKIEIKSPGFINFFLNDQMVFTILSDILEQKDRYGSSDLGQNEKVQIEFVSANPTGPLTVAHARQAAVGDTLGNVLSFLGFDVTKEYYVNDEGNQINILGDSIRCRCQEELGQTVTFPEDGYQGDYIKDIAKSFLNDKNIKNTEGLEKISLKELSQYGVDKILKIIKHDLDEFRVDFDNWAHQSEIADTSSIKSVLDDLEKSGHIYKKDEATWFKSIPFGDDKDRVVQKSDGQYTYLTPDIVYHKDKFQRGFKQVINIWGPDHHGYIPRLKAAVGALGQDMDALKVLIVQLATLYRAGEPIAMSTRRGQFISLKEVIGEVGVDVARFFFLMRHIKVHLDFDLELAKKQSAENPVYYIQYAHARIHSINKKAADFKVEVKTKDFALLKEDEELAMIKFLGRFQETLTYCYDQLDPYPLGNYMHELAIHFHRFYDKHKVIEANEALVSERLGLINATLIVIGNGLRLLGLSAPEEM